jgi:hypothetical protein
MTQVLRENKVRTGTAKRVFIESIESLSRRKQFFDLPVDFSTGASVLSNQRFDHDGNLSNRDRKVAFVADADQLIGQIESSNHFCCPGDE